MITLLEEYETQSKLWKNVFILVTSLLNDNRVNMNRWKWQEGCLSYKQIELRGEKCRQEYHIKFKKKPTETLDYRWLYHGERKMILNENDSRAIPSS